ncbi:MAG: helix-turn-helix domain-containing protein [Anaerolineae bacterium]|nr:helix-turn-helix domain-containing protein [Anaerolineae bacterium]
MNSLRQLEGLDEMRVLADERRLAILQRLMAAPATLSQLGQALGRHPAWVRHHLKQLEEVGLVEPAGTKELPGFIEKYYRASARAFTVSRVITPKLADEGALVAAGSHDLALELLARRYRESGTGPGMWIVPLGSLDGLIALRQGVGQIAGCHLLDAETGDYNLPYVKRLFPGEAMALVTLAFREQGLIVPAGNPLGLAGLPDVAARGVRLVNRPRGSGTRLWLDRALEAEGLGPGDIVGYQDEVSTHTEVAQRVAERRADVGLGILAAARAEGLEFVPLFHERFELVAHRDAWERCEFAAVLELMESRGFRTEAASLGGYDLSQCGQMRLSD